MEPDFEKKLLAKNGEKGVKNMRFRARLSNQTIDLSDFWYKTSLIYNFKYGKAVLQEKFFWAENGEKGVKDMRFRARLGNQSIDFSDFGIRLA